MQCSYVFVTCFPFSCSFNSEAEKAAQVSKIQYDQKIMEKESLRKMSEIEGETQSSCTFFFLLCRWFHLHVHYAVLKFSFVLAHGQAIQGNEYSVHPVVHVWEAQWPNDYCSGLQTEWPRFEPWLGHCIVFLGKTLLSQYLSPPRCINGYRRIYCWG